MGEHVWGSNDQNQMKFSMIFHLRPLSNCTAAPMPPPTLDTPPASPAHPPPDCRKVMQLISLRSFARVVLVAGSAEQVQAAIDAAVPYKDKLVERGVLVVGLPIFGGGGGNEVLSKVQSEDLRWVWVGMGGWDLWGGGMRW
jgi:hypothetical protein